LLVSEEKIEGFLNFSKFIEIVFQDTSFEIAREREISNIEQSCFILSLLIKKGYS